MKYILSADWHVRSSAPVYRVDDYCTSILNKVDFVVDLCNKEKADLIIAGDIFHSVRVNIRTINRLIRILKKIEGKIWTVAGQHDQEHHGADMIPTPYLTLMEAGIINDIPTSQRHRELYGIGWNGDIDEDIAIGQDAVLVMHHCVTKGEPPFYLTEASSATDILDNFPEFKFIVTGDFHSPHVTEQEGRFLINCGAIGRAEKDKFDFKPRVYMIDTSSDKVRMKYIPVQAPEKVFNIPENTKELDAEFLKNIEGIVERFNNKEQTPDFISTVRMIMDKTECTDRQKEIAEEFYNGAKNV